MNTTVDNKQHVLDHYRKVIPQLKDAHDNVVKGFHNVRERIKKGNIKNSEHLKTYVGELFNKAGADINHKHAQDLLKVIRTRYGGGQFNSELPVEKQGTIPREAHLGVNNIFKAFPEKLRDELLNKGHSGTLIDLGHKEAAHNYWEQLNKAFPPGNPLHKKVAAATTNKNRALITARPDLNIGQNISRIIHNYAHELGHILYKHVKNNPEVDELHSLFKDYPMHTNLTNYHPDKHNTEHFAELNRKILTNFARAKKRDNGLSLDKHLSSSINKYSKNHPKLAKMVSIYKKLIGL